MAITFGYINASASPDAADVATPFANQSATIPASAGTGDLLILGVVHKWATADYTPTNNEAGWSSATSVANGTVVTGNGVGSQRTTVWTKTHDGSEQNPALSFTNGYSPVVGNTCVLEKTASGAWTVTSTTGHDDTDTGTSLSAAGAAQLNAVTGDMMVVFVSGGDNDATRTSPSLTVPGCTVENLTERFSVQSGTGNDAALFVYTADITAGSATGAPTFAATTASGESDSSVVFVLAHEQIINQSVGRANETDTAPAITRAPPPTSKPTFVSVTSSSSWTASVSSATTAAFNANAGDYLVAVSACENGGSNWAATPVTNSGTGLSWTNTLDHTGTNECDVLVGWAVVDADRSGMTVTVNRTANNHMGCAVYVYRYVSGMGTGQHTNNGTGAGAPSLSITTGTDHSGLVVINADWTAQSGARTYRQVDSANPTEDGYKGTAGSDYIVEYFHYTDAGAAGGKTVGLTAPTDADSQRYAIAGIEIKGPTIKNVTVGQAAETDTAATITRPILCAVGQASESDAVEFAVGVRKSRGVGEPVEPNSADAITTTKTLAIAAVAETDTASVLVVNRDLAVDQAAEGDTAQAATAEQTGGEIPVDVLQTLETDELHSMSRNKGYALGQAW